MSTLKKIYYKACSMLPMSLFRSGGPSNLLLPYHHTVSNQQLEHIYHLYRYKNEKQFSDDIDFLMKNFKPLPPDEITHRTFHHLSFPPGSFLLSFDDGFREVYDIIAPILEKKGVPAIFFINPAFIGNKKLFYRCKISILIGELKRNENSFLEIYADALQMKDHPAEQLISALKKTDHTNADVLDIIATKIGFSFDEYLRTQQPFLTPEQVIDLHKRGFMIGAHSMDHPYYKLLPVQEQIDQTIESCRYVQQLVGQYECHFSFPHSDTAVSQETITAIHSQNKGVLFGIQNQKDELYNGMLHRFNAERPESGIEELIKGQITLNRLQKLAGLNTVKRN